jgi:hypothetical protein
VAILDPTTVAPAAVRVVGASTGDVSALVASATLDPTGRIITIVLSVAPPDQDTYTITVAETVRTMGGTPLLGDTSLTIKLLAGDVDGSGQVTTADIVAVRAAAGQAVAAETARFDVDCSGAISGGDMLVVRQRLGAQLP